MMMKKATPTKKSPAPPLFAKSVFGSQNAPPPAGKMPAPPVKKQAMKKSKKIASPKGGKKLPMIRSGIAAGL